MKQKSTHSSSGVVGVLQEITLCCDEILFEIILSAGTEILRENSAFVLFNVLVFLCLLLKDYKKFQKIKNNHEKASLSQKWILQKLCCCCPLIDIDNKTFKNKTLGHC